MGELTTLSRNTLPAAAQALVEAAEGYRAESHAANTRRAYEADWRDFVAWCQEVKACPLPADSRVVALYLTAKAASVTVATLGRRLSAIRTFHKLQNETVPQGGELDQVWSGIRRSHGQPAKAKRALVTDDLVRAIRALPDTLAGKRDRALLLIGFGGALRRSELASLELDARGAGPLRVAIVSGGLEIHLDRSKADQEGRGAVVGVPYGANAEVCPVRALEQWLEAAKITKGPIFRKVNRWAHVGSEALTPHAIALIVKGAAERIGLDPEAFAGHSLRRGLLTSAAANGADPALLMNHARHARFETTRRYIEDGQRFKRNAAAIAGL